MYIKYATIIYNKSIKIFSFIWFYQFNINIWRNLKKNLNGLPLLCNDEIINWL